MEKQLKLASLSLVMLLVASLVIFTGCNKDDEEDPGTQAPVASFQFEVNEMAVTFTNYSKNSTSYAWDFGDGTGTSTDKDPVYTYTDGGAYTVTLVATGQVGLLSIQMK